jgi:hypothetical protein
MSAAFIQVGPPGYFTHISITTPVVSALKNYFTSRAPSGSPNGFSQKLLDPGGGFTSETERIGGFRIET